MASTLVQSTNIGAAYVHGKRHKSKQSGGFGVASVRMICNSSVPMRGGLIISAPSLSSGGGGGGFNALDKFHSKVSISIAAPCGRGIQCVARSSMFKRSTNKERLTNKGMDVLNLSYDEATGMGHHYVNTAHILLGLIAQESGIAAKVLKSMGICLKDARVEVEKIIGTSNRFIQLRIPFITMRTQTYEEARELGHNYIDTEHLLLGLLREDKCVAVRVLENLGADPNNIRTQVIRMVNGETIEAVGDGVRGGNTNRGTEEEVVAHIDPRVGWIRDVDRVMNTGMTWPIRFIMRAHAEASRLGHWYMGTEQILLALIVEGTGIAAEVLKSNGINIKDARVEVEKITGRGNGIHTYEVPITPQAKHVLELSLSLGHNNCIGYEHLLLGLLHDCEGVAVGVLENLGADPNNIRTQVIQMIGESTITSTTG